LSLAPSNETIDLVDAYNAATMERRGLGQIYSYDADFDKLEGIARRKP
jgi:predicted nucleic acid-binding protein